MRAFWSLDHNFFPNTMEFKFMGPGCFLEGVVGGGAWDFLFHKKWGIEILCNFNSFQPNVEISYTSKLCGRGIVNCNSIQLNGQLRLCLVHLDKWWRLQNDMVLHFLLVLIKYCQVDCKFLFVESLACKRTKKTDFTLPNVAGWVYYFFKKWSSLVLPLLLYHIIFWELVGFT